jgi:hypothetical protein
MGGVVNFKKYSDNPAMLSNYVNADNTPKDGVFLIQPKNGSGLVAGFNVNPNTGEIFSAIVKGGGSAFNIASDLVSTSGEDDKDTNPAQYNVNRFETNTLNSGVSGFFRPPKDKNSLRYKQWLFDACLGNSSLQQSGTEYKAVCNGVMTNTD